MRFRQLACLRAFALYIIWGLPFYCIYIRIGVESSGAPLMMAAYVRRDVARHRWRFAVARRRRARPSAPR